MRYLAAVLFTVVLLSPVWTVALLAWVSRRMRGMQHGVWRARDVAARMSPGYLERHPNVAAHLYDWQDEERDVA